MTKDWSEELVSAQANGEGFPRNGMAGRLIGTAGNAESLTDSNDSECQESQASMSSEH